MSMHDVAFEHKCFGYAGLWCMKLVMSTSSLVGCAHRSVIQRAKHWSRAIAVFIIRFMRRAYSLKSWSSAACLALVASVTIETSRKVGHPVLGSNISLCQFVQTLQVPSLCTSSSVVPSLLCASQRWPPCLSRGGFSLLSTARSVIRAGRGRIVDQPATQAELFVSSLVSGDLRMFSTSCVNFASFEDSGFVGQTSIRHCLVAKTFSC